MKRILFCAVFMLSVWANAANHASLKGQVSNNVQEQIKLQLINPFNKQQVLEEVTLGKKGTYTFSYMPDKIGFFYVQFSENKQILVVLEPNKSVEMDFDMVTGEITRVENSEEIALLQKFQQASKKVDEQLYLIKQKGSAATTEEMAAVNAQFMIEKQQLCMENAANYATSLLLEYLPIESNKVIFDTVLNTLHNKYPKDAYIQNKYTAFQKSKQTEIGSLAPEIVLPDTNGKMFKLSSLKGKVVVIDFWASWCGPCRMENPNMIRLYNTYHQDGFEILGVSLDRARHQWLDAIHKDGLTWTHISDLKYWQSAAAELYGVHSIPHTVLLDKDGRIVAKGLRGKDLEAKVKELMDKK